VSIGYFMPAVNLFGAGCVKEVGDQAKLLGGKKAFLCTDAVLNKLGMADQVKKYLVDAGVEVVIFDGSDPNPTDKNVHDGVEIYKKNGCDMLVTLGGGSSHDCGKAIGIIVTSGGHITEYEGVNKCKTNLMPYLAINTTAGTASEMTRFAVITDTKRTVKMPIGDWRLTPSVSFNDPEMHVGMPPGLTAATGMDAMTHAIEAYVSLAAFPVTDAAALMAIKLIAEWLPKAVANGADVEARMQMCYAEFLGGMAFNSAVLGYVHATAHQPGGIYNKPHGECNAIMLPHVMQFNLIAKAERYRDVAVAMGENVEGLSVNEAAQKAVDAIKKMNVAIGIPAGLGTYGIKEADLEHMAKCAMQDICVFFNPRTATLEEVIQIYKNAL
jgi:alcohol dehydrogenase